MDNSGSLAQRLRWARLEQGVTLQQLSDRTGRAVSYLSQLEHGIKQNPTKQTVEALAEALGVRPAFLMGEVPRPPFDDRSDVMLAAQAFTLGERFRRRWAAIPPAEQLQLALGDPPVRFGAVVRFLGEQGMATVEVAWQLGISPPELSAVLEGGRDVSCLFLEQLSRVAGVPLRFFTHGELEATQASPGLEAAAGLRYVRAIQLALERKVSPEQLEALIRSLAPGDQ